MARVWTYKSSGKYPMGVPAVAPSEADISALTSPYTAMAQFGNTLGAVASIFGQKAHTRHEEQLTQSEFSGGKALWLKRNQKFLDGMRGEPDYKNYIPAYDKALPNIRKDVMAIATTDRARELLKNFLTERSAVQKIDIGKFAIRKETDYMRASTLDAVNESVKIGDTNGAISALARARDSGYFSAEETETRAMAVLEDADWNTGIIHMQIDPASFLELVDNKDYLPELNAAQKMQLKRHARTQMGLEVAQQRKAREFAINAEQGRLMDLARKGELTNEVIRNSQLDTFGVGSKSTFYSILDAQADAALKEKAAPFKESDPEIRAKVLEELRDPKSDIKPKDISDLVGKGLSTDDADRFISRMDVFKSFWFKRIDQRLKNSLQWSNQTLQFLHPAGALSYDLAMDELFIEIEKGELKEKELYERGVEISIPHIVDYWENFLLLEPEQIQKMRTLLEGKKPKGAKKFGPPTEYYKQGQWYKDFLKEMQSGKILDPEGIFK